MLEVGRVPEFLGRFRECPLASPAITLIATPFYSNILLSVKGKL